MSINHSMRRMMWHPLSVSTSPLIYPTFRLKAASSNGFCISPFPKWPRSPPFWQLEHYEKLVAISLKASGLFFSWAKNLEMLSFAYCLDLVTGLFLYESKGRRDSLCFCRIWAHLTDIWIWIWNDYKYLTIYIRKR